MYIPPHTHTETHTYSHIIKNKSGKKKIKTAGCCSCPLRVGSRRLMSVRILGSPWKKRQNALILFMNVEPSILICFLRGPPIKHPFPAEVEFWHMQSGERMFSNSKATSFCFRSLWSSVRPSSSFSLLFKMHLTLLLGSRTSDLGAFWCLLPSS